ncbi:PREDICTED: uncharacterized protein LOC109147211 [Ipomoea nil]|uniref:uncharacterized protein LOC109147211 n=1 Tax=Ipomoea nil TaxID=35883 RepID=UPI0009013AEC|nr:PREDICTED: uncharacterized protein LOC109147211 [Ipomoea nil]
MVSESLRPGSYAAAVTGAATQEAYATTPATQSPVRAATTSQRSPNLQRSYAVEDMENPYFISASDNPSATLVSPPLAGSSNYASWCISMRIALEVKNKWCLIDGSLPAPSRENNRYGAWRRCNLMVCSWIFRSVHASIAQSIMHIENAVDVWEDLRKRFAQCDAQRISALQIEIYEAKQGNLSVGDYYTKCRTLWEQMNALRPIPSCKCEPKGACDLIDVIRKEREIDQVIRFLQGLNDDYNGLKSSVLVMDPLPEVYKVFVMAEKVERQMNRQMNMSNLTVKSMEISHANSVQNTCGSAEEIVAAMNSYNGRRFTNSGSNKPKCTFCGIMGHTVDKCYKKHGYPPGWVPGYKSKMKQQVAAPVMNNTADLGISNDQFQKLVMALQNQMGQTASSSTTAAISLIPKFAEDTNEGRYLTSHVNSLSVYASTWILDSGATDHIACSIDCFDEYYDIEGDEISLPTGSRIMVRNRGSVKLGHNILLKDVMHIPSFQFNIVSVSKLLQDTSYSLIFSSGQCMIQKPHGMTVGLAEQEKGLYLMKLPVESATHHRHIVMQCNKIEIWH